MEGYLFKKGHGESTFGRRNWKQRWFVLDGQELSYYDDFDLSTGEPVGFKGKANISFCECYPINHHEKKNTFVVQPRNEKEIYLQAPDAKLLHLWLKEIALAARGEKQSVHVDYEEAYELLGLNMSENPSASDINRAYRKAALKCHPDKGGELDQFEKIQKAFNNIMAKLEEEEFERNHKTISYDVVLTKEPGEVGLGMVVLEDQNKRIIQIKDILPGMNIQSLGSEAHGSLKPGDILIAVAGVTVRGMPLSRVAQKLNQFRVPVGSTVKLTFERKVPRTSLDPEGSEEDMKQEEKTDRPVPGSSESPRNTHPENSSNNNTHGNHAAPHVQPSPSAAPHDHTAANVRSELSSDQKPDFATFGHQDSVLAENDELKTDLFAKIKALDAQRQENIRLERELEKHKNALKSKAAEQKMLEDQLKISYLTAKMSKEQLSESMAQLLKVSQKVTLGKAIYATPEIQDFLEKENLTAESVQGDQLKAAQRVAIAAAISSDSFGIVGKKWVAENESLALKLMSFEQKIMHLDFAALTSADQKGSPDVKRFDSEASVSTLGLQSVTHQASSRLNNPAAKRQ